MANISSKNIEYIIRLLKEGTGGKDAAIELKQVQAEGKKTKQGLDDLRAAATGVFAGAGVSLFVKEIFQARLEMSRFERVLIAATGSQEKANKEMQFAEETANRYGLKIEDVVRGHGRFMAATRNTAIEGEQSRQVFLGVIEAVAGMNLSSEEARGTLLALEQIMSKGVVSAEELRGQLGERIPGAFDIARRAIGVSTQELNKMLEQGQLVSAEFLPKFAAQLREEFGGAAANAADSPQGRVNALSNSFLKLKIAIGESGLNENVMSLLGELSRLADKIVDSQIATEAISDALHAGALAATVFGGAVAAVQINKLVGAQAALLGMSKVNFVATIASLTAIAQLALTIARLQKDISAGESAEMQFNLQQQEQKMALSKMLPDLLRQGVLSGDEVTRFLDMLAVTGADQLHGRMNIIRGIIRNRQEAASEGGLSADELQGRANARSGLRKKIEELNFQLLSPDDQKRIETVNKAKELREEIVNLGRAAANSSTLVAEALELIDQLENQQLGAVDARKKREFERIQNAGTREQLKKEREAEQQRQEKLREGIAQANQEFENLEIRLQALGIHTHENARQRIDREFNARLNLIDDLANRGVISGGQGRDLERRADLAREEAFAALASEGANEAEWLDQIHMSARERRMENLDQEFEERRARLEAFYDQRIALAEENAEEINKIERERTATFIKLEENKARAASQNFQIIQTVAQFAAERFSSGMASSVVDFVSGVKSAEDAFRSFAASFLREISQMILKQLIFNAITNAFGGTSVGRVLGFAEGGIRLAGAGLVSTNIPGVHETTGPVMFPKHNVLAGEAGKEMLAVLSNPQRTLINGIEGVVGKVQGRDLALMPAPKPQLSTYFPAMDGIVTPGVSGPVESGSVGARGASAGNGTTKVHVMLEPGLRGEIVDEAAGAAEVKITNSLQEDTPVTAAVKAIQ